MPQAFNNTTIESDPPAKLAATGPRVKPHTLCDVFFAIAESGNPRVMLTKASGAWQPISSSELYSRVVGTARTMQQWGIEGGDRVAILSENRPEWATADFATLLMGAALVPIYATLTSDQVSYMLRHSEARVIFVSNNKQLEKVQSVLDGTKIEHIVVMDEVSDLAREANPASVSLHRMSDLMASGPAERDVAFDAAAKSVTREMLATLIYTSGTTGTPKGVMLTHGNLTSNMEHSLDQYQFGANELGISFLPLSHITARHLDYAMFFHSITIAYCPNIDDLTAALEELKPTLFVAVPRVYEKIYNKVMREVGDGGLKRKVYEWAIKVGEHHETEVAAGKTPASLSWKIANKIFFSKINNAMGGRVRYFVSGGAPLGRELGEWYLKIGIPINEGYGLTESSPVIAINNPRAFRLGTVGKPLPNVDVRIAVDGEILVRGPSIFSGYWNMDMETRNAFEEDWFKTGDIGHIDGDGFLSITDRKKDLIKTSGGKFIAPQPIENSLKANVYISEAAIIGERRRFACVLVAPTFANLEPWARENGIRFTSQADLSAHPKVQALYEQIISEVNNNLAQYEKLKRVLVLPEELSIANGMLTPTMKLKRRVVEEHYKEMIEHLYATAVEPTSVNT